MSTGTSYERVLGGLARGESPVTPKPPRASASVVLWRAGESGIEIFWVRRSRQVPFMPGWHAFPGGGLSPADRGITVRGQPIGLDAAPADGAMPPAVTAGVDLDELLPEGLLAATLRELFEETGLLPGAHSIDTATRAAARRALLSGETTFAEILDRSGITPDAGELIYAGRWLTPPLGPLRFDNRFFLLPWREEMGHPEVVPGELAEGGWTTARTAHRQWRDGEIITAPPILHILEVLAEDGPHDGLPRLRVPSETNLGEHRRVEFVPGVLLFPLPTATLPPASHTNCYLIGFGETALIDPGAAEEAEVERLAGALEAAGEQLGRRPRAIWLTHHHPDHAGGAAPLQRRLDLPVRAHRDTMARLDGSGIAFGEPLAGGAVERLAGGDGALEVEVLHTPGHARGHLCFLARRQSWLVGGDMVSGISMIVIDPPEGHMGDYLESLRRLEALELRTLFPGHGPTLTRPSAKFRQYIEHRLWREGRILEAWRDGVTDPWKMLPTVYEDVPPIAHPLAVRQIEAHLEHLREQGKIEP
ncbi:MAG: MBL fold metallo-hydrolase [Thermoanaerobaculia bacterium]|nr:MBL fold metallo-hydrolase [Thermoanaerobaculia bacterium]